MDSELKPCPFCGGDAEINRVDIGGYPKNDPWQVRCKDWSSCEAFMERTTEAEAIAAWNRRALDATPPETPDERQGGDCGCDARERSTRHGKLDRVRRVEAAMKPIAKFTYARAVTLEDIFMTPIVDGWSVAVRETVRLMEHKMRALPNKRWAAWPNTVSQTWLISVTGGG